MKFIQLRLPAASRFAMKNTRRMDHETSIAAAERAFPNLTAHQIRVLAAHYAHPAGLTDFELEGATGLIQTSCGKRRGDLVELGYIVKTDRTRPSPRNSPAAVWQITPAGKRAYEEGEL